MPKTMKATHTSEPWAVSAPDGQTTFNGRRLTVTHNGNMIADLDWNSPRENMANAERIVSCVNGCQCINPAAVPELVAALEQCRHALDVALCGTPSPEYFHAVKRALKVATATSVEDNLALNCAEIKDAAQKALDAARAALAKAKAKE